MNRIHDAIAIDVSGVDALRVVTIRELHALERVQLLIFRPGDRITVKAAAFTRMMLLGGAAMEGPRYIWWNFVSSSKERIEQAKEDWAQGRFKSVPGETEFIPLPEK